MMREREERGKRREQISLEGQLGNVYTHEEVQGGGRGRGRELLI